MFAIYGGREDPNETAAVPNENVLESIELEGDPLIALRQVVSSSQAVIRRELDRRVELENANRELTQRNEDIRSRNQYLERLGVELGSNLVLANQTRDILQMERDFARSQAERLRDELEERQRIERAQQETHRDGRGEETGLLDRVRDLERANGRLRADRESATRRADRLQEERDQLDYHREQFEMERDHYQTERDRERDQNQVLQARIHDLTTRPAATQALAPPPTHTAPPGDAHSVAPPPVVPPPVASPQVMAPPAGLVRGSRGRHGRGGAVGPGRRGGRSGTPTREQPERACKVEKNYRK